MRLVHLGGRAELVLRPEGGGEAPPFGVRVRRVDAKMDRGSFVKETRLRRETSRRF